MKSSLSHVKLMKSANMQDARHHKSLAILTIRTTDRHKAWAQLEPGVLGIASQNAHEARLNVSPG